MRNVTLIGDKAQKLETDDVANFFDSYPKTTILGNNRFGAMSSLCFEIS